MIKVLSDDVCGTVYYIVDINIIAVYTGLLSRFFLSVRFARAEHRCLGAHYRHAHARARGNVRLYGFLVHFVVVKYTVQYSTRFF
jgi:hypothetical protein